MLNQFHVANGLSEDYVVMEFGDPQNDHRARRLHLLEESISSPVVPLDCVLRDIQATHNGAVLWNGGRMAHLLGW